MVCPKLDGGVCRITKKTCMQPYEIKMIKYKDCKIYKKGKSKPVKAKTRPKTRKIKGKGKSKIRSK